MDKVLGPFAGAVVTRDVSDYPLICGNPARQQGWICACGIKLKFSENLGRAACGACRERYRKWEDKIEPEQP